MFNPFRPPTTLIFLLGLSVMAAPIASAGNKSDKEIQAQLMQIQTTLNQVLTLVTPPAPAVNNKTRLLYPFASGQNGFDTGIVISNTGVDDTGTVGSAGTATIYFFPSDGTPITTAATGNIPAGGQYVGLVSSLQPTGFQGYIEVVCNFPFAHGWMFFSDTGARNLAANIPALVLPLARTNTGVEALGQ